MPQLNRPQRAIAVLWAAVTAFVLALGGACWAFVEHQHRVAWDEGAHRLADYAVVAEAAMNRLLQTLDLRLDAAADALAASVPRDAQQQSLALVALVEHDLVVHALSLVDEHDLVLAASRDGYLGRALPLPPGFTRAVLDQPEPKMLLLPPGTHQDASNGMLLAARPLRLADGRSALVVAELPLALVAELLGPAVNVEDLQLTLERDDGTLLASAPRLPPQAHGRLHPPLPALDAVAQPVAVPGRVDEVPALVSARPLRYPPLLVGASWHLHDMLARHDRERQALVLASVIFSLFTLAAGALGHAYLRRMARARTDLAASKALLDQALASIAEGFLLCDRHDCVLTWNQRYLHMFPWLRPVMAAGVPYCRLAETAAAHLHAGEDPAVRRAWVDNRLAMHREANRVWEQDLGNGVFVQAMERRTPDGGTVSVFRDVSAKERRLEEARRAAEQANLAKSRFLATMSHEIRTPLNAVLGLATLLLDTALTGRQRAHVELMRASGQNLLSVINDILDVTQIEAGRMRLQQVDFEPMRCIEPVVELLGVRARDKGLALRLEVAPPLPAWLRGDPDRLAQVLFNLVGNAVKFTDQGSVTVRVRHACRDDGGIDLTLQVEDTGIGIPPELMPHLFERFMQVDGSTRRRHGGSGLGLSITRDIVQLMGGLIGVTSQPGQGSCFTVQLPLAAPQDVPAADPGDPAPAPGAARRVLVAEDNEVNRLVIQAMLEQLGHRSDVVDDGEAVVEQLQRGRYDLVLMDMQMPRLDGLAATRAIRRLPGALGQVPVVAMTANALASDRRECHAAGMTAFIPKPVDLAQLARVIDRACAQPTGTVTESRFASLV